MRKNAFFGTVSCVTALILVAPVQAQNASPTAPVPPIALTNKPLPLGISPIAPGSDKYNVHLKDMNVVQIIEELARTTNKKVIFSDEVLAQKSWPKIEVEFSDILISDLMQSLSNNLFNGTLGIAWGTLGENTWLVVKRPIPSITLVKSPPLPLVTPPQTFVLPDLTKADNMPPGSKPFTFNGQKHYVVPLQK